MKLDALLENGSQAMAAEVKTKLDRANIDEQIRRMEKVRRYADMRGDKRHFFRATAALTASGKVIEYAPANGLYHIMPSWEDVKITGPASEGDTNFSLLTPH
jgi:L-serine deaminase